MGELIVVRHGEAEGNARGLVQGRRPYPLTATGRRLELRCGTCMRLVRKSAEIHAFTHLIHPEEMELE